VRWADPTTLDHTQGNIGSVIGAWNGTLLGTFAHFAEPMAATLAKHELARALATFTAFQ
jgi:hypothetical protein